MHTDQPSHKPLISLQQALDMVKANADNWAAANRLKIPSDSLVIRLSEDGQSLRVQTRLPKTPDERRQLENYAWVAAATFLGYRNKYEIIHK